MDAQAMMAPYFSGPALLALQAAAWLGCGLLIGMLYFLTLQWSIQLVVTGRAPLLAMTLQLGRFALVAGTLALIVSRFGALPLLVAATGILAARTAAIRMGAQT
jgi:F1F0 ATPase subunit 2